MLPVHWTARTSSKKRSRHFRPQKKRKKTASTMTTMPRRSYISTTIIYEPSLKSISFLSVQTMRIRKSAQVSQLCQALEPWYQLKWNGDGVICFLREPLTALRGCHELRSLLRWDRGSCGLAIHTTTLCSHLLLAARHHRIYVELACVSKYHQNCSIISGGGRSSATNEQKSVGVSLTLLLVTKGASPE